MDLANRTMEKSDVWELLSMQVFGILVCVLFHGFVFFLSH